jgi:hypothetical protein
MSSDSLASTQPSQQVPQHQPAPGQNVTLPPVQAKSIPQLIQALQQSQSQSQIQNQPQVNVNPEPRSPSVPTAPAALAHQSTLPIATTTTTTAVPVHHPHPQQPQHLPHQHQQAPLPMTTTMATPTPITRPPGHVPGPATQAPQAPHSAPAPTVTTPRPTSVPTQTETKPQPPAQLTPFQRLHADLQANPHNTSNWRKLLEIAEHSNEIDKIHIAYRSLLAQYPNTVRIIPGLRPSHVCHLFHPFIGRVILMFAPFPAVNTSDHRSFWLLSFF